MAELPISSHDAVALCALSPDIQCIVDADEAFLWVSANWESVFGYGFGELSAKRFTDFVHGADLARVHEAVDKVHDGGVTSVLARCRCSEGAHRWIDWRFSAAPDGGAYASGRDITDRRTATDTVEALRTLEGEAEQVAQLGSWRLDLATNRFSGSPEMYRIFGMQPSDADLVLDEVAHSGEHHRGLGGVLAIIEAARAGGDAQPIQTRVVLVDGTVKWVEGSGKQILNSVGRPVAITGFIQDITVRKLAELEAEERERRLQALIDNAPFGAHLYRLEPDDRLVFIGYNRVAESILGIDHAPLVGLDLEEAFPGNVGTATPAEYRRVACEGTPWEADQFAYDGNGLTGVFEVYAFSFGPDQVSVFFRDVTEQRAARAALQASEARFRGIFEQASVGIAEVGIDGKWKRVNDRLCEILGYTPAELSELTFGEITHPDDRGADEGHFNAMLSGEFRGPHRAEKRYLRKDGSVVWVNLLASMVRDEQDEPQYVITVAVDITQRKASEDALAESEAGFRAMFEGAAVGMARVSPEGRWLDVNDRICELLGYSREELTHMTFIDVTHPEDVDASVRRRDSMAAGAADSYEVEKRYLRKDGSIVWVHLSDASVRDEDGKPKYFITAVVDISERKASEQALAESERFVQSILGTTPNLIYIHSLAEGRNIYTNREVADFLGYSPDEIRGFGATFLENVLHPDDVALVAQHHVQCALTPDGQVLECEYRMRAADGTWRWLHSRDLPFRRSVDGEVTEILGVCEDVTSRRKADADLRESNVRLEQMVYDVAEAMGRVIEVRDPYTRGHQQRVAKISKAIAIEMGMSEDDTAAVEMAALVHDIGKLSVPAEILSMPRKLTQLEYSLIQEHPQKGYEILKDIDFPWPIADIVRQHHERLDGTGYPDGAGEEMLLPARVLAVADVVEAMASHRPYRPALGLDAAVAEITDDPGRFDSTVVEAVTRLIEAGKLDL